MPEPTTRHTKSRERKEVYRRCPECGEFGDAMFVEALRAARDNGPFRGGRWEHYYGACTRCKTCWVLQVGRAHTEYTERPVEFRGYREIREAAPFVEHTPGPPHAPIVCEVTEAELLRVLNQLAGIAADDDAPQLAVEQENATTHHEDLERSLLLQRIKALGWN